MIRRSSSDVTITDQFCGAGGSSQGASGVPGVRIRMALNHWKLAIETHNTNFPETDHDCTDVSACDPRRYPSTTILITSPECTNHSLAKGKKRKGLSQGDFFVPAPNDPAEERSRATMWDVPRFAEFHGYEFIIVENVPDAAMWVMWDAWLHAMHSLGYKHRVLSLNSMFHWPCPQSRDRIYVVFWKAGNHAPDLDFMPLAWCDRCRGQVHAVQAWKVNPKTKRPHWVGRYKRQYVYTCSACRDVVEPYYFCALNALDFSIPAERIGDRARPLKERTLERIRYGLEKYGRQTLVVTTRYTTGVDFRVRDASGDTLPTQPGDSSHALVSPLVVETAFSHSGANRSSGGADPLPTQDTRATKAMVVPFFVNTRQGQTFEPNRVKPGTAPLGTQTGDECHGVGVPFITTAGSRETGPASAAEAVPTLTGSDRLAITVPPGAVVSNMEGNVPRGFGDSLHAVCTGNKLYVAMPPAFVSTLRGTGEDQLPSTAAGLDGTLGTVSAGGIHHALVVQGAALLTMRDSRVAEQLVRGLDNTLSTQVATCTQDWLLSRGRYLVSYDRTNPPRGVGEEAPTFTTVDRVGLVEADAELRVEDCYFRMLQPQEIQAGMAFDSAYVVLGNKRDKVKQLGNAVTPPVMQWIVSRCVAALEKGGAR